VLPGRDGARPGLAVLHAVEMSNTVHVHPQAVRRRDARTRTRTLPLWRRTLGQLSYIPLFSYRKPSYSKNRPFRLPGERFRDFRLTRYPVAPSAPRKAGAYERFGMASCLIARPLGCQIVTVSVLSAAYLQG
jgi:hypothetical protein